MSLDQSQLVLPPEPPLYLQRETADAFSVCGAFFSSNAME
jgi:hypothetical protein